MISSKRFTSILIGFLLAPVTCLGAFWGLFAWIYKQFPDWTSIIPYWLLFLIVALLTIVSFIILAHSFSTRVFEQLSLLTKTMEAMNQGKIVHPPENVPFFREFQPLFDHTVMHLNFHQEIIKTLREILQNPSDLSLSLRSEYDELNQEINALIARIHEIEHISQAVAKGNLSILATGHAEPVGPQPFIHLMLNELRTLISQARHYTNEIVRTGSQINSITTQGLQDSKLVTKRITEISQSIHKMATNIQSVADHLQEQTTLLEDTSSSIERTARSVEDITLTVTELKSLVEQNPPSSEASERTSFSLDLMYDATKTIEQDANSCVTLSQEAAQDTEQGQEVMQQTITGINQIQNAMDEFFQIVRRLGDRVDEVSETLEVISDIADHTNLLAINAAIISAHAGEHGRDFAVIADEIGKFAERTRESTHEIEELLRTIHSEFQEAMQAMEKSSRTVSSGVNLSHKAGKTLKKLSSGILKTNEMVSRIAAATADQSRENDHIREILGEMLHEQNARQEHINHVLWQLMQAIAQIRGISTEQAEGSARMATMADMLHSITTEITQASTHHVSTAAEIGKLTNDIRKLAQRTVLGTEKTVQLTDDLFTMNGNLAFTLGEFVLTERSSEERIVPAPPFISFVRRSSESFFQYMASGIRAEAEQAGMEVFELVSSYEAIMQIEDINWLLKQPGLQGVIICPVDPNVGQKLVQKGIEQGIQFVSTDESLANTISVRSGNREGGRRAAELFKQILQPNDLIGVLVDRTVESLVRRVQGFRQKAEQYGWDIIEIYCDVSDYSKVPTYIAMALEDAPELKGLFLPNEGMTTGYLNALHRGRFTSKSMQVVGFDYTPTTEQAIQAGELLGAIYQHPEEIGKQAFQYLHKLITQQIRIEDFENLTIYIPTQQVTQQSLRSTESNRSSDEN